MPSDAARSLILPGIAVPLADLGGDDPHFSGIWRPASGIPEPASGITHQFLERAAEYHARYASMDKLAKMRRQYESIFRRRDLALGAHPRILDIGAGSGGNSILPLSYIFPLASIVATDLSPNLLSIARDLHRDLELTTELTCIRTDACAEIFEPESFDLIVGTAILHHLIDPAAALHTASGALKPGGTAIFFEPFELGHMIVATAFKQILLHEVYQGGLSTGARKVLTDMLLDWSVRARPDKSDPLFAQLDDKWLFTQAYLAAAAGAARFDRFELLSFASSARMFRDFVEELLRLHSNFLPGALPDWAWKCVDLCDESFTETSKAELPIEAWILLRKADTT